MGKDEYKAENPGNDGKKAELDLFPSVIGRYDRMGIKDRASKLYWLVAVLCFAGVWHLASLYYDSSLLLPSPMRTAAAFFTALFDAEIISNMLITLRRVLTGLFYAVMIGVPLGFLMGYSKTFLRMIDPLISSARQIPIMAWVPLTIVWLGLGDGPTIFLIAMAGVFPVILNTISGVHSVSEDYYNAARSLGANHVSLFAHVVVPGSLPSILGGMRLAVSAGWMSVI
jgi:NitT/TauT family transport system permease protein